jgi:hypothetical protein
MTLTAMFKSIIAAEPIEIDAPLAQVWAILLDVANYAHWNPFTPRVETTFAVGSPATLHVVMNPRHRRTQYEVITAFEAERQFAWSSIMPLGLLKANRWQLVEALDQAHTRYRTYETFQGLLVPLIMALYRADVQHGFDTMSAALKREALSRQSK